MAGGATPFGSIAVAEAFAAFPDDVRERLLALRALVLSTAHLTAGVGRLEETLKWGEPAYLTSSTNSGSTVRLGWKKSAPAQYVIYFNCKTDLVDTFRSLFPGEFKFEGNRAIVFALDDVVPLDALAFCISAALTYHRRKSRRDSEGNS
ncbi:MAG: DUF1801 domain-containing protein [Massilia sp.]